MRCSFVVGVGFNKLLASSQAKIESDNLSVIIVI